MNIKTKIFYNYKSQLLYKLLGYGARWDNTQDVMFLLCEWQSGETYSVPDYIFQMDFIQIDRSYFKEQLEREGWSEFSIKRFYKDYLQAIHHVSS
ncbi:hypothetical protein GCM10008983_17490 [Lentibacillus halophilus]|uniref:Uncharacterized protein n=1 Tax=Lentibacillus halophilus TaxID=295065 RepID=A0ABP3J3X4_9BACI